MPMSEARKRANKKWNDANLKEKYESIHVIVPKGNREKIQAVADSKGQSINAYIKQLIKQDSGLDV